MNNKEIRREADEIADAVNCTSPRVSAGAIKADIIALCQRVDTEARREQREADAKAVKQRPPECEDIECMDDSPHHAH